MKKNNDDIIYLLKGVCIPITGYNRGIIYNLLDNSYYYIPKEYSLKLTKSRIVNKNRFSDEAILFFIQNNLIINVRKSQINQFPQIKPEYIEKKDLEHVVFEVDNSKFSLFEGILEKIKLFDVRSFEFILAKNNSLESNIDILNYLKNKINKPKILNIDYNIHANMEKYFDFSFFEYLKFYSYQGNELMNKCNNEYHYLDIEYWKMTAKKLFFNFDFFTESLYYHPVFNKMLYIDKDGIIKQTALGKVLGDSKSINKDMLNKLANNELWNLTKDKCDVCMDCEYRFMCIDARLPTEKKDFIWHFDNECNYNPYICEWKGSDNWISVKQWRKENQA